MQPDLLADRLEMLLVAQWLEAGASEDGTVAFTITRAVEELGCTGGRRGLLEVMGALCHLEEAQRVRVEWSATAGGPATAHLAEPLRRDTQAAFNPPAN
jgi:hypothetical protein